VKGSDPQEAAKDDKKEVASMRRIMLLVTVGLVMALMMAFGAGAAFADRGGGGTSRATRRVAMLAAVLAAQVVAKAVGANLSTYQGRTRRNLSLEKMRVAGTAPFDTATFREFLYFQVLG
jgi:FtsH-binding integral membrane protein